MMSIDIPESQEMIPWVQSLVDFVRHQERTILEQARVIQEQAEQIAILKTSVQELRDEITRLKNTPKRPKFRPSKTPPSNKGKSTPTSGIPPISRTPSQQKTKEEIVVKASDLPEGSRVKGYADYSIQELMLTAMDVVYRLEIWQAPDGTIIKAPLPPGVEDNRFLFSITQHAGCTQSAP